MSLLRQLIRRIFPRPHRPVQWTAGLSLLAFLALFLLAYLSVLPTVLVSGGSPLRWTERGWLDLGFLYRWGVAYPQFELVRELEFSRPWAFLLLLFVPWIWWLQAAGHSGLPQRRGGWAGFIRLVLCGLLIFVLAEPRAVRTSDTVSVVYSVDVSDSVSPWRSEALNFVAATAAEKPGTDEAGLVVFGRTPAVEYPPRVVFPFERFVNSQVGQDATNLEQSLALSAAMLPEENVGRIVLVSDGTETVGQLKDVLGDLQARGVSVSVVPMNYVYESEVLLERLDLPRFVRQGETYEASVVLNSLKAARGTLVLSEAGREISRREIEFPAGKTRYSVPIRVDQPGYYEYSARIEVSADSDVRQENNEVRNYLYLDGPGKVLLVRDVAGRPEEIRFLEQALRAGDRQLEVITALEFPQDPLSLMPYDAVIFADVPADAFLGTQIQAMHDAIRNLGIGFLMVGGPNSFGPGGWQGSLVEDALPISMEITNKKVLPKGALAIILHTCEFPQGNTWAKRITKRAIQVLNSQDEVGVLAQTMNGDEWIFDLTPASEYESLATQINNASIGDMGTFGTTMQLGLASLLKSDAASRHMIIISDGDAQAPTPELLGKFIENQVSVSTVAVFPHNGDASTLQDIAGATGGRFYFPSDPNELPSIFVKEAKTLRRTQIQTRDFVPVVTGVDPILRDIVDSPELHGYVLASRKEDARAVVVLSAPQTESEKAAGEEELDPILAVWRYGLGVTAAWTSDFTDRWGRDWVKWDQFQQLLSQTMTRISRTKREQSLRVYTYVNGNEGVVVVEDFHPEETLLDVNVSVTGPNGFEQSQAVRQIAPRRYQTSMPLKGEGRYQVLVGATDGARRETAYAGFIVSYSPEYLRFRSNPAVLREIAESTGGLELEIDEDPVESARKLFGERPRKRSSRPIFEWYLILAACLLPLDVAVRRVQLDAGWLKRLWRRDRRESTATLGTLLERTTQVRSARGNRSDVAGDSGEARPLVVRGTAAGGGAAVRPAGGVSAGVRGAGSGAGLSGDAAGGAVSGGGGEGGVGGGEGGAAGEDGTTSRLLALKRRRDQERGKE